MDRRKHSIQVKNVENFLDKLKECLYLIESGTIIS